MKYIKIIGLYGFIALFTLFGLSLVFPRFATSIVFGVNTGPVPISLHESFEPRIADEKTKKIVLVANQFIQSLSQQQREKILYEFSDNAQRANWSNYPEGMIPRGGIQLRELEKNQISLLYKTLQEILSEKGMKNVEYQLLAEDTFSSSMILKYGTEYFYVAILGEPSNTQPWMFQFGGHHIAINTTIYGNEISFSPMLTGGQPNHIHVNGEDINITGDEAKLATELMDSLSADQRSVAIQSEEVIDLIHGPGTFATNAMPEGIKGSELSQTQKKLLLNLIEERMSLINKNHFDAKMVGISGNINDTHFGWWGSIDKIGFAYYRIVGPTLIIEYAPQIESQEDKVVDHVHSIYRDPVNDYAVGVIGK